MWFLISEMLSRNEYSTKSIQNDDDDDYSEAITLI